MPKLSIGPDESKQLRQYLRKVDYFADLAAADFDSVLNRVQLHSYDAGTTLFKKGDPADALYIVCDGQVAVKQKKLFFLPSRTVESLGPGDFFGEMALLEGKPRSASVESTSPVKLFVLRRSDVDQMIESNGTFRKHMSMMSEVRKFVNTRRG